MWIHTSDIGLSSLVPGSACLRDCSPTSVYWSKNYMYVFFLFYYFIIFLRVAFELQSLLQIVKSVPDGVLCFFPSYGMMQSLMKRWGCRPQAQFASSAAKSTLINLMLLHLFVTTISCQKSVLNNAVQVFLTMHKPLGANFIICCVVRWKQGYGTLGNCR